MQVCINGDFCPAEEAKVSVFDHGLLYGDGVFETVAAVQGKIFWLEEHLDRLLQGCEAIFLRLPWSRSELASLVWETFRRNGGESGRLRITITRGEDGFAMHEADQCRPNLIIFCAPFTRYPPSFYERGMRLMSISQSRRVYPHVKSISYLPSVMAHRRARQAGFDDALFVDENGFLLEGPTFNIFVVRRGVIYTPMSGVLPGVTQAKIVELARRHGYRVEENSLPLAEALLAEEWFASGSTRKIAPVVAVDEVPIGDETPGPVTRDLMAKFGMEYY